MPRIEIIPVRLNLEKSEDLDLYKRIMKLEKGSRSAAIKKLLLKGLSGPLANRGHASHAAMSAKNEPIEPATLVSERVAYPDVVDKGPPSDSQLAENRIPTEVPSEPENSAVEKKTPLAGLVF